MGHGGGRLPSGALLNAEKRSKGFDSRISAPASANPNSGEISSAFKTLITCAQSNPDAPMCGFNSWFARPTPMIDPTSVCELDAGSPRYHVPRFHRTAAISKAKIIEKPEPELTFRISSTGRRVTTANATVPEESNTPA